LSLGFDDSFRLFAQPQRVFSWWDYRAGAFRRNHGLRIDLILTTPAFSRLCTGCRIDAAPRRLPRPSDHAPVVAEFRDH
jgi:exodeoxyribonuclease-3